jgi:four helix bundle protein
VEKVRNFKDLRVWQQAVELATEIYAITEKFPKTEQFGLSSQMRRSSVSIASNIAEGHGRSNPQFERYLDIAIGSLAELNTQCEIASRVAFLSSEAHLQLNTTFENLTRQLHALKNKVRSNNS